jgi:tetratricopeptide (TPR) repeat protein
VTLHNRGGLLRMLGRTPEARLAFDQALKLLQGLTDESPLVVAYLREQARVNESLGELLAATGQIEEAERAVREGIRIFRALVAQHRENPDYRYESAVCYELLGNLLRDTNQVEAQRAYEEAQKLSAGLVQDFPTLVAYQEELAACWTNLGTLYLATNRLDEAQKAFGRAVVIKQDLVNRNPQAPEYRRSLGATYLLRGLHLLDFNRPREAEEAFRQAREHFAQLVQDHEGVPAYQHELARAYSYEGKALGRAGQFAEARAALDQAVKLETPLVAKHADVPQYRFELALAKHNLGILADNEAAAQSGTTAVEKAGPLLAQAERDYQDAVRLLWKLTEDYRDVPDYQIELATARNNLGYLLLATKRSNEALDRFEEARAACEQLVDKQPIVVGHRLQLARSLNGLAEILGRAIDQPEKWEQARKHLRRAVSVLEDWKRSPTVLRALCTYKSNLAAQLSDSVCTREQKEEAVKIWREVEGHRRTLADLFPEHPGYLREAVEAVMDRAAVLESLGDPARMAEAANQLADLLPADSPNRQLCARLLARGARLARTDANLAGKYADRAMGYLQQAVKGGYKVGEALRTDKDFEALWPREDFKKLVKDGEGKAKQ